MSNYHRLALEFGGNHPATRAYGEAIRAVVGLHRAAHESAESGVEEFYALNDEAESHFRDFLDQVAKMRGPTQLATAN